ncbi:hypothetical protein ES702_04813 [subsurface metagenome]
MNRNRKLIFYSLIFISSFGFSVSTGSIETIWSTSSFGDDDFFHRPSDMEVDSERALFYVADSGNHRILVFDFQGKLLRIIGRKGQGPAEFSKPTGLHILEDGGLAVADVGNRRIQIFGKDGKFVKSIKSKSVQVADMIFIDNKIYSISAFGSSRYRFDMHLEKDTQPLVNILNNQGNLIQSISVDNFPESHPYLRALKHRVCLALSRDGKLYIPHFAMNVIHVFDLEGNKISEFRRPLPFKPMSPKLVTQRRINSEVIEMGANLDYVTREASFGADGYLYLLTYTQSNEERGKQEPEKENRPPHPMRIEVIDPKTYKVLKYISCDPGTLTFALIGDNNLVYIYEDNEGEITLKCIKY